MARAADTPSSQVSKRARAVRARTTRSADEVQEDVHTQQGWTGGADDGKQVVGLKLINLVRKTLIERNLPERHVSDLMGITQIYWNSMTNGNRRISSLPKEKLARLAQFLEIPLIQVYVLADHFSSEDFVVYKSLPGDLERMIEFMRTDPTWLAFAPTKKEWDEMSTRSKVLVAALYERIVHRSFLQAAKVEIPPDDAGNPSDR